MKLGKNCKIQGNYLLDTDVFQISQSLNRRCQAQHITNPKVQGERLLVDLWAL